MGEIVQKKEKTKAGRYVGLAIVVVMVALAGVLPVPEGLTRIGLYATMLFLGAIVLWICDTWPFWVTGMLVMFIMPLFGVMTIGEAYTNFGGSSFSFLLGAYAITAALTSTTWADRIAATIVSKFGKKVSLMILVLLYVCAFCSSFMANMATTAMFITLVRPIMAKQCPEGTTSNLAKCMYIGIPVAVNVGGTMMICGTPSNVLTLTMLEGFAGISVSFVQWMIVGIPMGIISVAVFFFIITKVFKPEPLKEELIEEQRMSLANMPPLTKKEILTVVIIGLTIAAWILSTWVKALNTTITAFICMALLMCPGIDIVSWKKLQNTIVWNSVLLCGSVNALVAGLKMHSVPEWVVNNVFAGLAGSNAMIILLAASLFFAIFRNFMPGSTAFVTFMSLPMFGIAQVAGLNLITVGFMISYWGCVSLILPFDPIYMLGMGDGYFGPKDTIKSGSIITPILVVVAPFVLLALTSIL